MPPPDIHRDRLPLDQVKRDLTMRMVPFEKAKGLGVFPFKGHVDRQGRYVVTYDFDAPLVSDFSDMAKNIEPPETHHREAMLRVFAVVESAVNIHFRPPEPGEETNLRFGCADFRDQDFRGLSWVAGASRDILFNNRLPSAAFAPGDEGELLAAHELMHTLGLSHPGDDNRNKTLMEGRHAHYSTDGTSLSGRFGGLNYGVGPLDAYVLQQIYGPSKASKRPERAIDPAETTLVAGGPEPLALTLNPAMPYGDVRVDLGTPAFAQQLHGALWDGKGGQQPVGVRFVPGTRIRDVHMAAESEVAVTLTGNDLPNRLQGGRGNDWLIPRGGGDVLITGVGEDRIAIDERAGFANVAPDFDLRHDSVRISRSRVDRVTLNEASAGEGHKRGTQAVFHRHGRPVASLLVEGVRPESLAQRIEHNYGQQPVAVDISPADPLTPSMLPPVIGKLRKR